MVSELIRSRGHVLVIKCTLIRSHPLGLARVSGAPSRHTFSYRCPLLLYHSAICIHLLQSLGLNLHIFVSMLLPRFTGAYFQRRRCRRRRLCRRCCAAVHISGLETPRVRPWLLHEFTLTFLSNTLKEKKKKSKDLQFFSKIYFSIHLDLICPFSKIKKKNDLLSVRKFYLCEELRGLFDLEATVPYSTPVLIEFSFLVVLYLSLRVGV